MTDVSYVPGERTAIVADRCWMLVDAAPDSAAVAEIWQRIGQGATLGVVVAGLLRIGLDRVPDFALLVAASEGRHHLICRGQASATLIAGPAPTRVDGAGLATWLEYPVPAAAERVVLGEPPADTVLRLPAAAGVLLARSVVVDLVAASPGQALASPDDSSPDDSGPDDSRCDADADTQPDVALPGIASYPDTVTLTHPVGSPTRPHPRQDIPRVAAPADDMSYDYLFGMTQARTVEDAAIRPADDGDPGMAFPLPLVSAPAPGPPPGWPPVPPVPPVPPAPPAPSGGAAPPRGLISPGGLIDAVPWASPPGPQPAATPPNTDDGPTITRADLQRLAARPVAPDRIGPTVHALLCPDAHANPPTNSVCWRCGAPLPQQDPVTVPRPVLGVLRLSSGDVIALDRGVVMGRSPRADFSGEAGEERPHIVKLPSDGDISRTHLRVSLDGWHVLVTDLNSTNGTLVTLPGRDAEQLRPGEALPIPPGTVVTLADGIDFRYEVTE